MNQIVVSVMQARQRLGGLCQFAILSVLFGLVAPGVFQARAEGQEYAKPQIRIEQFDIGPTRLRVGESFVIRARAACHGVRLGSFLLRTADEVPRASMIPGLALYVNRKYYLAEQDQYFLKDNGALDQDPRDDCIALSVSTATWKPGTYVFAFFASIRPAPGPFLAARRDFAVVVEHDHVMIEELGQNPNGLNRSVSALQVTPRHIQSGQTLTVGLETNGSPMKGIEITNPYFIAEKETLRGFCYLPDKKKSYYSINGSNIFPDNCAADQSSATGTIVLNIDTKNWPAGVHHLMLNVIGIAGRPKGQHSFAIKVAAPQDRLEVRVDQSRFFSKGTHFEKFIRLRNATLLCEDKCSLDGGRNWTAGTHGFGVGGMQLPDGRVLGLQYRCLPEGARNGWYRVERSLSIDHGQSFTKTQAQVHVAQAKAAMGHGRHVGPLFMRSIVQRRDGSLLALMAGWFQGDDTPCPYGRGRSYSRTYTCQSGDDGLTWTYLNTIAYDQIGSEGFNEGTMRRLPNGDFLAVLRTGNERDFNCQDNPIMWSVSRDEGGTWSSPRRTGVEGAFPSLAVLSDGQLVMSYGRPGAMIVFSADNGQTWTDQAVIDTTPYSGYTDVVEIGPGHLLVGFGAKDYLDSKTGMRSDQIRLADVWYETRE